MGIAAIARATRAIPLTAPFRISSFSELDTMSPASARRASPLILRYFIPSIATTFGCSHFSFPRSTPYKPAGKKMLRWEPCRVRGLRLPARNLNLEARRHTLMANASFIRRKAAALVTVSNISKGTPQARHPRLGFFVNNISAGKLSYYGGQARPPVRRCNLNAGEWWHTLTACAV